MSEDFGYEKLLLESKQNDNLFVCGVKEDEKKTCKFIEGGDRQILEIEPQFWGIKIKEIDSPSGYLDFDDQFGDDLVGQEVSVGF